MLEHRINIVNTFRPRQNGRHFADDTFEHIILNENVWTSIKISLKFVPTDPIDNIPSLVNIMDCRQSGDKPLSDPMMVRLPTHICVSRPQWVNLVSTLRINSPADVVNSYRSIIVFHEGRIQRSEQTKCHEMTDTKNGLYSFLRHDEDD